MFEYMRKKTPVFTHYHQKRIIPNNNSGLRKWRVNEGLTKHSESYRELLIIVVYKMKNKTVISTILLARSQKLTFENLTSYETASYLKLIYKIKIGRTRTSVIN